MLIGSWYACVHVVYLVKRLNYAFPFSCLVCILLGASPVAYIRQGGIFFRYLPPFKKFCQIYGSSVTYISWGGTLLLDHFFFLTYTNFRDFAKCMALSVTYIRQGGILLLSHFFVFFLTYTHLKDFAKCMDSSVTYIRQGGILLLSHFFCLKAG